MKDPLTFEQQLSALAPAAIETDALAAMYRCGFAAGQASHSDSHARSRPPWLQLVAAACLTAVLVGPISYQLGHPQPPTTIVEQSPAAEAVVDDDAVADAGTQAPAHKPAVPADGPPKLASVSTPPSPSQSLPPIFGGWLIGMTVPPAPVIEPITSNEMVLTSRPPSADTMAWLERSRPEPVNSIFDPKAEEASQGRGRESNRYRLPPLPSRNSVDTWEPWIQS